MEENFLFWEAIFASLIIICVVKIFFWFQFTLGCVGLACIGLSFVLSISLCSLLGIFYGPVHTSLPFLLLGIGVDDMFVIISCWKHLTVAERKLKHEEKIATTLKHAGVSITVTSITDLVAFLVGSLTVRQNSLKKEEKNQLSRRRILK